MPLSVEVILAYFEDTLKKNQDNNIHQTFSKFNNHKSAICYLHKINKTPLDAETEAEMSNFLNGYKKLENDWRLDDVIQPLPGKRPLPYAAYKMMCEKALISSNATNNKDNYHLYTILAWNLATRSVSTGRLKYRHFRANGDHLVVSMSGAKNNQDGARSFERLLWYILHLITV